VLNLPAFVARPKVPNEQPQTGDGHQADGGENRDDSSLHSEKGRSATSVIIRKERGVAEDFSHRYLFPEGIRVHNGSGNIARSEGDGAAFLVGGSYIHRGT
jgi:hypothetical protein